MSDQLSTERQVRNGWKQKSEYDPYKGVTQREILGVMEQFCMWIMVVHYHMWIYTCDKMTELYAHWFGYCTIVVTDLGIVVLLFI